MKPLTLGQLNEIAESVVKLLPPSSVLEFKYKIKKNSDEIKLNIKDEKGLSKRERKQFQNILNQLL